MWCSRSVMMASALAGALTVHSATSGQCEPEWLPAFGGAPGVNGRAKALAVFDDGSGEGPAIYVGGYFNAAGGTTVNRVAKWDGQGWCSLGEGVSGDGFPWVFALMPFDDGTTGGDALYVGGGFDTADGVEVNGIARWDGEEWSALDAGTNGTVYALTSFDDGSGHGPALHVAGDFGSAGGVTARSIARWNGTSWSPLGEGVTGGYGDVFAMQVFDDGDGPALYVSGEFTAAGGIAVNNIARWDGNTWSAVGDGLDGTVRALAEFDDGSGPALYAGGSSGIAKWDGTDWVPLGSGVYGAVSALLAVNADSPGGPALYVGGSFESAGGVVTNDIAKWDGATWSALSDGVSHSVAAISGFDDDNDGAVEIIAGGLFEYADEITVNRIARWDPSSAQWSAFGDGLGGGDPHVGAVVVFDDGTGEDASLYVGGEFSAVGGITVSNIARWNDGVWSALGDGLGSTVHALAVYDDGSGKGETLYAGGDFGIVRWDGAAWIPLDPWNNGDVYALTVFDDGQGEGPVLCVGGDFYLHIGGIVEAFDIAAWDGEAWSTLGTGLDGNNVQVHTLISYTGSFGPSKESGKRGSPGLYVGGRFTTAGSVDASNIAKWDGSEWSAIGDGVNGRVNALAVFEADSIEGPGLCAGGSFNEAGGVPAQRVAIWNGSEWAGLGSGMDEDVYALAAVDADSRHDPALYAGGDFLTAGGIQVDRFARWDGHAWADLGGDLDWTVHSVQALEDGSAEGPTIYVGGGFSVSPAGDSHLARWGCPPVPCTGDIDGDGDTDQSDLGLLLASYELPPDDPFFDPRADLDGDGEVGQPDLGILLADYDCVP
jgi:hypothetical protein